jgi:GNAT superfamily N-acetyltransferase
MSGLQSTAAFRSGKLSLNSNFMKSVTVRPARADDANTFLLLVEGLADYENLLPPDAAGRGRLVEAAFGKKKRFDVLLAEIADEAVGYAVIFETYSTFLASPKLFLEDLFVKPEHRGSGAGHSLLRACAREAVARGCARMEWVVLDWNEPAIGFYRKRGASHLKEWYTFALDGDELTNLSL